MISEIEYMLKKYDLILIIEDYDINYSKALAIRLKTYNTYKKDNSKKVCIIISDEYKDMVSLFYTYEYSDKVKIVGRSRQYGGLFNLVDVGLISEEQAFETLLR